MRPLLALISLLFATAANAQNIRQSGNVTPGHPMMWVKDGVAGDGGVAVNGFLTGVGVMAQGPGICQNSAAISLPHNQICLSVSATAVEFIVNNIGGATGTPVLIWNGTQYPLINAGGGGSGSFTTLGSPAALAAAVIPAGITSILVTRVSGNTLSGYNAAGVSTCGLTYNIGTAVATGVYGEVLNTPSNIYWEPDYSQSPVRTCEFGAIGDGTFNQVTGAITGTDNTAAIQAAIDYALRNQFNTVCINDGMFKITDTLQMGWGQGFFGLSLVSCNTGANSFFGLSGVMILPTKTDRCAVNIQGGRTDVIRDISFWGQNDPWITNVSFIALGTAYPSTASAWFNPALVPSGSNPGGLQQHSPYSAICIDAYKGAQPTDHYPTVTYPAWTGVVTQYNKAPTSDVLIQNVEIAGFAVGINASPNGDGNGDFVKISRVLCQSVVYCISIGNTQSRNVRISDTNGNFTYALVTNNQFGVQQGKLDGPMDNISCSDCYELFQLTMAGANGFTTIKNMYAEATIRVGSFNPGGDSTESVTLEGCDFNSSELATGLIPAALFDQTAGSGTVNLSLNNCSLSGSSRIQVIAHGGWNLSISGGEFGNANNMAALFGTTAAQLAINYTGSAFAGGNSFSGVGATTFIKWAQPTNAIYFIDPVTQSGQPMGPDAFFVNLRAQMSQSVTGFYDAINGRRWNFALNLNAEPLALASGQGFTSVAPAFPSCDTLTFTYIAALQSPINAQALSVGDILYHNPTGTLFFISAIGAPDGSGNYPITAKQLNNMYTSLTSPFPCATNNISDPTLAGTTFLFHTTITDIPSVVMFGTFTSGSTSVTNVQRGDGFGGNLNSYVQNGDRYYTYPIQDSYFQWPYPYGTTLSSVTNGSPGSLSLSANATQSGRFPLIPLPVTGGPQ